MNSLRWVIKTIKCCNYLCIIAVPNLHAVIFSWKIKGQFLKNIHVALTRHDKQSCALLTWDMVKIWNKISFINNIFRYFSSFCKQCFKKITLKHIVFLTSPNPKVPSKRSHELYKMLTTNEPERKRDFSLSWLTLWFHEYKISFAQRNVKP